VQPRSEVIEPEYPVVDAPTAGAAVKEMLRGRYPARYEDFWEGPLRRLLADALSPGARVLDVGSGVEPTIHPEERPEGTHYVGLDVAQAELDAAPAGSYDESLVADLTQFRPELEESFDLIVSFQVLEHVKPLDVAIENMRRYLKPGGTMVHKFSGGRSLFARLHRLVPFRLAVWIETTLRSREPESMFPTHYDRCNNADLERMTSGFSKVTIIPQYTGALYLKFARPLQALYLAFEERIVRKDRRDLAVYYVLSATR
jgi:SAM-dependent methyltransferase